MNNPEINSQEPEETQRRTSQESLLSQIFAEEKNDPSSIVAKEEKDQENKINQEYLIKLYDNIYESDTTEINLVLMRRIIKIIEIT